jgi:hypothetical protein
MIGINEVKQYTEFLAKKWQSGAVMTPDQFNLTIPNVVRSMVRKYYGLPEQYQINNPSPAIAMDNTQLVVDYLSAIKTTATLTVTAQGYATLPSDYIHKSTARYLMLVTEKNNPVVAEDEDCDCDEDNVTVQGPVPAKNITKTKYRPIRFLTDDQFDAEKQSAIREPSMKYPIARIKGLEIEVAPIDLGKIELTYVRYPKKPFWNYTVNQGIATYSPTGSQNIEMPEICAEEIVYMCLNRLGISIREPMLIQWAERNRQMGS